MRQINDKNLSVQGILSLLNLMLSMPSVLSHNIIRRMLKAIVNMLRAETVMTMVSRFVNP